MTRNQTILILTGCCMTLVLAFVAIQEWNMSGNPREERISAEELQRRTSAPESAPPMSEEELELVIKSTTASSDESLTPEEEEMLRERTTAPAKTQ